MSGAGGRAAVPAGWWPLVWSAELGRGEVQPRRLHGREVVLWRGESGRAHVMDAFCLHLGHHLGYNGQVLGDDVRCFFHGWQWSPEGHNTRIPYDEHPHRGRRITAWPVHETGGLVLVAGAHTVPRPPPELPAARTAPPPVEAALDPALLLENLLDPHTARVLLGKILGPEPPRVGRSAGCFVARYHGTGAAVEVAVHGPGLAVVDRGGHTATLAVTPRGEAVEVRWGSPDGADRAKVCAFVELAARMATCPPAGVPAIGELRAWLNTEWSMSKQEAG